MELIEKMQSVSVNDLLNCISALNMNEQFTNSVGPQVVNKIINTIRNESKVISLRKFHNWVKGKLITNVKKLNNNKITNLLDIAVGRGGDLYKWEAAGINYVTGFDNNPLVIDNNDPTNPGAIQRYKSSKVKVKVNYLVGSIENLKNSIKGKFDFVSCQFALHYFFKSESMLRNLLSFVSSKLKKDGYFYGTTVDGEKIKKSKNSSNEYYTLKKIFKINELGTGPFGKEYLFDIKDTIYFNTSGSSNEYLVNFEVLTGIAREYSLVPEYTEVFNDYYLGNTNIYPFESLITTFESETKIILSPQEKEISFLNSIFIFKKN
jgi:mRNA (guanine-N7-)-methyltransferase